MTGAAGWTTDSDGTQHLTAAADGGTLTATLTAEGALTVLWDGRHLTDLQAWARES